jgi:hypothetical protein
MTLEFPDLPGLAEQFRQLPKSLASAAIGAGVKRALKPAEEELKRQTPVGPTGNLRRGIATKAKRYTKTGSASLRRVAMTHLRVRSGATRQTTRRSTSSWWNTAPSHE